MNLWEGTNVWFLSNGKAKWRYSALVLLDLAVVQSQRNDWWTSDSNRDQSYCIFALSSYSFPACRRREETFAPLPISVLCTRYYRSSQASSNLIIIISTTDSFIMRRFSILSSSSTSPLLWSMSLFHSLKSDPEKTRQECNFKYLHLHRYCYTWTSKYQKTNFKNTFWLRICGILTHIKCASSHAHVQLLIFIIYKISTLSIPAYFWGISQVAHATLPLFICYHFYLVCYAISRVMFPIVHL